MIEYLENTNILLIFAESFKINKSVYYNVLLIYAFFILIQYIHIVLDE